MNVKGNEWNYREDKIRNEHIIMLYIIKRKEIEFEILVKGMYVEENWEKERSKKMWRDIIERLYVVGGFT